VLDESGARLGWGVVRRLHVWHLVQMLSIKVWLSAVDTADGGRDRRALEATLGPEERQQIADTASASMRAQRRLGYALRRAALAWELGLAPADVSLRLVPDGPAELLDGSDLSVGLSHTDGVVAVAVARGARVAVDVERVRARAGLATIAARYFPAAEAAALAEAPLDRRAALFFRLWTEKESLAKASGRDLFDVLPVRVPSEVGWWVNPIEVSPEHVGAVAVEVPDPRSIVAGC
jgi:4'-phosphopantetheinyl transferase